jgi:galactokinase
VRAAAGSYERLLHAHGCRSDVAAAIAGRLVRSDDALTAAGAAPTGRVTIWAPGRIEVFGKHTDYAGGRSLLTAVERGFAVRAAPRHDRVLRVMSLDSGQQCESMLDASAIAPDGQWSNYIATVARRVALNFPSATTGVDLVFTSDLPIAAGVSSSTALLISVFLALAAVNSLEHTSEWQASLTARTDLAGYLGAMEMGGPFGALAGLPGVGTLGGSQDQTAILCAAAGAVSDFSWMPVQQNARYPLPASQSFVVAASGIVAEKSAGARAQYNRASLMVRHLRDAWNRTSGRHDHSLAAAATSSTAAPDMLRDLAGMAATADFSADALRARLDQFLRETYTIVPAAAQAFAHGDWATIGDLAALSQDAAAVGLQNQIPETTALVRLARAHGADAASAFGAGFGGSVWALVNTDGAAAFLAAWLAAYRGEFPRAGAHASFFATAAGPPAGAWPDGTYPT